MAFIYFNANPLKNNIADCTIRAISFVERKRYKDTFRELSEFALERGLMMDSVESIEKFLDSKYTRACFNERMTIGEFARSHKNSRYLATCNGHITSIIFGDIYDTWDCRSKRLRCVWEVPNKKSYFVSSK